MWRGECVYRESGLNLGCVVDFTGSNAGYTGNTDLVHAEGVD